MSQKQGCLKTNKEAGTNLLPDQLWLCVSRVFLKISLPVYLKNALVHGNYSGKNSVAIIFFVIS